jgi:hypothetical protein
LKTGDTLAYTEAAESGDISVGKTGGITGDSNRFLKISPYFLADKSASSKFHAFLIPQSSIIIHQ